jgi:hypothetical protein
VRIIQVLNEHARSTSTQCRYPPLGQEHLRLLEQGEGVAIEAHLIRAIHRQQQLFRLLLLQGKCKSDILLILGLARAQYILDLHSSLISASQHWHSPSTLAFLEFLVSHRCTLYRSLFFPIFYFLFTAIWTSASLAG